MLSPPKIWVCRCAPPRLVLHGGGYWTHDSMHTRQALYTLIPSPVSSLPSLGGICDFLWPRKDEWDHGKPYALLPSPSQFFYHPKARLLEEKRHIKQSRHVPFIPAQASVRQTPDIGGNQEKNNRATEMIPCVRTINAYYCISLWFVAQRCTIKAIWLFNCLCQSWTTSSIREEQCHFCSPMSCTQKELNKSVECVLVPALEDCSPTLVFFSFAYRYVGLFILKNNLVGLKVIGWAEFSPEHWESLVYSDRER